jgi:ferric-dicitrate binding protein FerR (iron transport regulator)
VVARDHAHLAAWLARDERHRRAWLELRQLWEQIGSLATALAHALPPPMEVEPPQPRMRR